MNTVCPMFRRRLQHCHRVFICGCLIATSANAQFGGFSLPSFPSSSSSNASKNSDGCPKGKSKSEGSSVLGGFHQPGSGPSGRFSRGLAAIPQSPRWPTR